MVDHEDFHLPFFRYQREAQLPLNRSEDGGLEESASAALAASPPAAVKPPPFIPAMASGENSRCVSKVPV